MRELKIIFCVIRYTYGFNRKTAELSSRFIVDATSIKPNHVFTTVKDLINKNVLLNKTDKLGSIRKYQLNKDYETWLKKSQKGISPETVLHPEKVLSDSPETVLKSSPVKVTKKENIKENSKENIIQLFPSTIHPIQQFVKDECTRVSKLTKQLTFEDCQKLCKEYPEEEIKEVLLSLENYRDIKKYVGVYQTLPR